MRVTKLCFAIAGLVAVLTPLPAFAQGGAMPAPRARLGLNVVPMPVGTVEAEAGGFTGSDDMAAAFGFMPFLDFLVTPNFFIGFTPTYILNVKSEDADDAGTQLDLLLRLGGGAPVSDRLDLYGYLAPGYSIVDIANVDNNAKGFALGIHGGVMFSVSSAVFLNGELGYQIGFQEVSLPVIGTVDSKTSYLQIGLGGGLRL
jgi:hypothetical protein